MSTRPAQPLFTWLWRGYLSRYKAGLAVAFLIMAIEGSALGLFSLLIRPMFDRVLVGGDAGALWLVGGAVCTIFIVRGLASMAQKVLLTRIAERSAGHIRADMLGHLMTLDTRSTRATAPVS